MAQRMNEYKLSIVFCAVDESVLLEKSFQQILQYGTQHEYIFIPAQHSSAQCLKTIKRICDEYENCKCFVQPGKGLGDAIRYSFTLATGTHLLIWPADNGMESSSFPKMLALSKLYPNKIIKISRWLPGGGFVDYGRIRKVVNFFSQKLFAFMFHSNLTDFTNPTQIAPLELYKRIQWENSDASFLPEMVFKPLKCGEEFIEVPCVNYHAGNSNIRLRVLIKYYFVILKIFMTPATKMMKS